MDFLAPSAMIARSVDLCRSAPVAVIDFSTSFVEADEALKFIDLLRRCESRRSFWRARSLCRWFASAGSSSFDFELAVGREIFGVDDGGFEDYKGTSDMIRPLMKGLTHTMNALNSAFDSFSCLCCVFV